MYVELPAVTATPADRLEALKDAKKLMSGSEPGGFAAMFSASAAGPGSSATAIDGFLRLAEYITTGHDYKDTHPEGKRRPIIRNTTHVTVVDPSGMVPEPEDIEHFLHHVQNGDFAEFLKDAMKEADAAHERAADEAGDTEDPFKL